MAAAGSVAIVGGGISGLCLAIGLARADIEVQVLESSADGNVLGIGMALQAPALQVLQQLGLLEQCLQAGFPHQVATQLSVDGHVLASQPVARPLDDDAPGQLGIQRKAFHRVLLEEAHRLGVPIRFGTSVVSATQDDRAVRLLLTDGSALECEVAVAADGAYSAMRRVLLGSDLVPEFTGQATWRIGISRPAEVRGMTIVAGGPHSVGINPVTDTDAYIFVVENVAEKRRISEADLLARLPDLLAGYGGLVAEAIAEVHAPSAIVYRPLESLIIPVPWYKGRSVLIGDAAHTTTPHMAAGALIAIQDAAVLTDELMRRDNLETALQSFVSRRYQRCKLLVEACRQIGDWQKAGLVRHPEAGQLQGSVMRELAAPL